MSELKKTHGKVLQRYLVEKRDRNPLFSLRAFAKKLGISPGFLSDVIHEKRQLSSKMSSQIASVLDMSEKDRRDFQKISASQSSDRSNPKQSVRNLEVERFRAISQWYHFPILDLTTVEGFQSDVKWIAQQLKLSLHEVKSAVERLVHLDLLDTSQIPWKRTSRMFHVPTQRSQVAVRNFHHQMIEQAQNALDRTQEFDLREVSGITFAADPKRIAKAKKMIESFQFELMEYLNGGEKKELYQFNSQLFRLTPKPIYQEENQK